MRGEVLSPVERRCQFGHRDLPRRESAGDAGRSSQSCSVSAPASGRCRAEPLQQRRPAEQIEILRVRMMLDFRGRLVGRRQPIPGPADSRQRELVDRVERVVPVDTFLDARVPHHQHGEDEQEREPAANTTAGKVPRAKSA